MIKYRCEKCGSFLKKHLKDCEDGLWIYYCRNDNCDFTCKIKVVLVEQDKLVGEKLSK